MKLICDSQIKILEDKYGKEKAAFLIEWFENIPAHMLIPPDAQASYIIRLKEDDMLHGGRGKNMLELILKAKVRIRRKFNILRKDKSIREDKQTFLMGSAVGELLMLEAMQEAMTGSTDPMRDIANIDDNKPTYKYAVACPNCLNTFVQDPELRDAWFFTCPFCECTVEFGSRNPVFTEMK